MIISIFTVLLGLASFSALAVMSVKSSVVVTSPKRLLMKVGLE